MVQVTDVDAPVPAEHEVLVRVHAASINDFDLFIMHPPLPFRVVGSIVRAVSSAPPRVRIPGCDVAGTVAAVGGRVERLRVGDAVFGDLSRMGYGGFGAFAEYEAEVLKRIGRPERSLARAVLKRHRR